MEFYVRTLRQLVAEGSLDPNASTLVIAGGANDRAALLESGFTDVTISNLDERMKGEEFAPYRWAFLDGERIDLPDGSFDQVIEHMGLHHCGSPHGALLEMYRVARKAVLVFENRDSATMRLAQKLKIVPEYELEAVMTNDFTWGGFRNTAVPNYVYRWTEREVYKTIAAIEPAYSIDIRFFYFLRFPQNRVSSAKGIRKTILLLAKWPFLIFTKLFPKQANEFGFLVSKTTLRYQPWIDLQTGTMWRNYVRRQGD